MSLVTFGVRRQIDHPSVAATQGTPVEAATALWFRIMNDPKRCRATLATALQRKEQP